MPIIFPDLKEATVISPNRKVLLITAYGFEERSLGWTEFQIKHKAKINSAIVVKYENPKGKNKVRELKKNLKSLGIESFAELPYDGNGVEDIEKKIEEKINDIYEFFDEIIIDVTPLTKFLILLFLNKLEKFTGCLRVVYTEANDYAPTKAEYKNARDKVKRAIKFPSKGFGTILRAKCLSSIRMQGQPVTLIAFNSFNEQLVRHMLGTISPHRLLFINGRPPRNDYKWREIATASMHSKLIKEYPIGNELNTDGTLKRSASTLHYKETIDCIDKIYQEFGLYERIILAATGSKMQTVGIYFAKKKHQDVHVEYPTPDSYYIKGFTTGKRKIYEIVFKKFSKLIQKFL